MLPKNSYLSNLVVTLGPSIPQDKLSEGSHIHRDSSLEPVLSEVEGAQNDGMGSFVSRYNSY